MVYDLIIVGGGPAAVAGGVYAARKHLQTLVLTQEFAGQSVVSSEIYNWIGTRAISGADLAKALKDHLYEYVGSYVTAVEHTEVTEVSKQADGFTVRTADGTTYEGTTVLIASGARRRKLDVPGAAEFDQKGLTYCATCDGPLFAGMDVAVIGSGNAGFETAAQLLAYVKSVTLLEYGPQLKADAVTVEKVLAHPNMKALTNANTTKITGSGFVSGLTYMDTATNTEHTLDVSGIFVEIGVTPNTSMVRGLVDMSTIQNIVVDARTQRTSCTGIWAAGDCTNALYAQNNIAVGDAIKAVEDIYLHLRMARPA